LDGRRIPLFTSPSGGDDVVFQYPPLYSAPMKLVRVLAVTFLFTASLAAEPLTLLDGSGLLLRFIDTLAPGVSLRTMPVTGLLPGEHLEGIDYRPANGVLYGVGVVGTGEARLYTINTDTGAATPVGSGAFHPSIGFSPMGMDFNPVVDRIRLISNSGVNLRVNPNDATIINDTRPSWAAGDIHSSNFPLSLGYSNNLPGATSTTLYGIVSGNGPFLATVGSPNGTPVSPNSGVLFTVGQTGLGGYFSLQQGMDISRTGVAYVVLDNDNILYSVNLTTGQATSLGKFPTGSVITDLSAPTTGPLRQRVVRRR
jgi:hypothetical protein